MRRYRKPDTTDLMSFWQARWHEMKWVSFYYPRLWLWRILYSIGFLDAEPGCFILYRLWPRYAQWPWITWRYRRIGARGVGWMDRTFWQFVRIHGLRPPRIYR